MVGGDGFNLHAAFIFLEPFQLKRFEFPKISFQNGSNEGLGLESWAFFDLLCPFCKSVTVKQLVL